MAPSVSAVMSGTPPLELFLPLLVDWAQILDDLNEAHCSDYKVMQIMGVEWSTCQRWRALKGDLGHGYGRALLAVHSHYCGEALTLQRLSEARPKA